MTMRKYKNCILYSALQLNLWNKPRVRQCSFSAQRRIRTRGVVGYAFNFSHPSTPRAFQLALLRVKADKSNEWCAYSSRCTTLWTLWTHHSQAFGSHSSVLLFYVVTNLHFLIFFFSLLSQPQSPQVDTPRTSTAT